MPSTETAAQPVGPAPAPGREWWPWALLAIVLLAGAGRVAATYDQLSITFDEPWYLVTGIEYLSTHTNRYAVEHPPLARAMAALLPYMEGLRNAGKPEFYDEETALLPPAPRSNRTVVLMRIGVLPFFLIATTVVFLWARWRYGPLTGVLAAAIFTLIPPVLAHAAVATTDMALTACLSAAFYSLLRWAESPTRGRAILFGCWTGLGVLSKFTTFLYLPASAMLAVAGFVVLRRSGVRQLRALAKQRAATFGLAVAVGAFVIWAGYLFSVGRVPGWQKPRPGALAAVKARVIVPAPDLVHGIGGALSHNAGGHRSYLLGRQSATGFWRFFPTVLSVKTPIPVLILFAAGLAFSRFWRNLQGWTLLAFLAGVLCAAMPGRINIGVRHVLPLYVPMAILAALALVRITQAIASARVRAVAIAGALLCIALPGIWAHPGYLAYTNAFAGDAPEKVLADSDLDWGQGFRLLGKRLRELGAKEVSVWLYGPWFNTAERLEKQYGFPPARTADRLVPREGWTVVSATQDKAYDDHAVLPEAWWDRMEPTERVGGLLLYYVPKQ